MIDDIVRGVAAKYDDGDHTLAEAVVRRLGERRADSGKRCVVCGRDLPLSAFGPDGRNTSGLQGTCRDCQARRARDGRAGVL